MGYYDTKKEQARLMDRSVMDNQGKTMVGDSVWYDSKQGFSQAFRNVIFVDTVNKTKMTGNYGEYWENTGYALCTDSAVAIDFSQGDSLYMHADTFKVVTFNIDTDSVYRKMHAFHKVRAYRTDVQAVCDSLVYNSLDSCMTMYRDPIVWNNSQQLVGEEIQVFMKDSLIDRAHVIGQAFSIQQLQSDTACYNQVSSKEMFAFFVDGNIHEAQAKDNVLIGYYFEEGDTIPIIYNYQETTELRMFMKDRKLQSVWTPKTTGTMYPLNQIPPQKKLLPGFMWYDYIRPKDRYDIFVWRGKKK
jgi:lipopolysaccharide export system protein LptA